MSFNLLLLMATFHFPKAARISDDPFMFLELGALGYNEAKIDSIAAAASRKFQRSRIFTLH